MNVCCVTLNPAIDQVVKVDNFLPGTVNRGSEMHLYAGGKGINVASCLADAGLTVHVSGFLGWENTAIFDDLFSRKHFTDQFIRIPGSTRTSVKIDNQAAHQTTDINLPGLAPSQEALDLLFKTVQQLTTTCDWFVLSGSLPPKVPDNLYFEIIELINGAGRHTVLDTSGTALRSAVFAKPEIIKPNLDELRTLTGEALDGVQDIARAARVLNEDGITLVIISMGNKGALFSKKDHPVLIATPPEVQVVTTVGAGDALVAGYLYGLSNNACYEDCARLATAFALAVITSPNRENFSTNMTDVFGKRVQVREAE